MGKFLEYVNKSKKKEEEEKQGLSSSSKLGNFGRYAIGQEFKGLQSDLDSLFTTIGTAYDGWQTRETMNNTLASIKGMYNRIGTYQNVSGADLSELQGNLKSIMTDWDELSRQYARHKNADAYNQAMQNVKNSLAEEEKMKTDDLNVVRKELSDLEGIYNKAKAHNDILGHGLNVRSQTDAEKFKKAFEENTKKRDAYVKSAGFDSYDALEKAYGEKKKYLNRAEWLQKGIELSSIDAKDFEEKSKYVAPKQKVGIYFADETEDTYRYINDEDYRNSVLLGNESTTASLGTVGYEYMTDEEKKIYNYYYNNGDKKKANEYLNTITESLGSRKSMADYEKFKGNTVKEMLYGINAGLDQFATGMKNVFNFEDDYIPVNSTQQLSGLIRDDLNYEHGGLGTIPYDLFTTTSNMLPSILASTVIGTVSKTAGAYVGSALMGASASGNAYQEMLNLGYDKLQSKAYSSLVGVSEATLQNLIGGIGKLGGVGKLGGKITKALNSIDNAFGRFAINYGKSILAEGFEESVQEVLTPVFKKLVTGEEMEDIDWGEVAYSGLLGMMSGGLWEGVPQIAQARAEVNQGKSIKSKERTQELFDLANNPEIAEAYETYTRYAKKGINAENVTDAQLGRLYNETTSGSVEAMNKENISDVERQKAGRTYVQLVDMAKEDAKITEAKENAKKYNIDKKSNIDIKDVSIKDGKAIVKTKNGEVSADDISLTKTDADIVGYAEVIAKESGEDMANLFLSQYDGETSLEKYSNDFNLAKEYADKDFSLDHILKNKGSLSGDAVSEIYKETVIRAAKEKQTKLDKLVKDMADGKVYKAIINDSAIDYDNTSAEGKINWKDLSYRQQRAVTFVKGFAQAIGMNLNFTVNSPEFNGRYNPSDNILTLNLDNMNGTELEKAVDSIIPAMSHETTHWMKNKSPELWAKLNDVVFSTLVDHYNSNTDLKRKRELLGTVYTEEELKARTITEADLIERDIKRLRKKPEYKNKTDDELTDIAREEIIARACEDMLKMSEEGIKMFSSLSASEQKTLVEKFKALIEDLLNWVRESLNLYKANSTEARIMRQYEEKLKEASQIWDAMLKESVKVNQALEKSGKFKHNSEIAEKLADANAIVFNEKYIEQHYKDLKENYSEDSTLELSQIVSRYGKVVDIWKRIGGKIDSKFLEDWNSKVGKDRTFTVFKKQAGYKYNIELSTMCKKGIPLFEAIDTIVKKEVMKELDTKTLGKAEKEILYDILKTKGFEIPCAICYVEQARQREGTVINDFLNGKIEENSKGKVTQFKLGWNETLKKIQNEMKKAGVDYTFPSLDRSIATEKYTPSNSTMDEKTQEIYFEVLKKIANEEIRRYNKDNNKNRKLITKVTPEALKDVFKGKLPLNLQMFRTLFNESSSRVMIDDDLLYSSMTTLNLATMHNQLYSLFNSQGGVGGFKTKQGSIVYWGDILRKNWIPEKLRNEGGVRNQSNSDFLMYTFLDHAQMFLDFTAKGYYLQAYTKVLAELKLFGLSNAKHNASFIPKVTIYRNADGSINESKTRENAGLDEKGNLDFDDIEGIPHNEAFMLIEDENYSKSICGVCIGYSDNHILKLLDDSRIQLVIGFHDKTDDASKRYKGAKYSKNYNGINEATKLDSEGKLKTVHIGFNKYVKQAEGKFKNKETYTHNGKTYTYNDIPRLAADLYLSYCESKGLNPAYSQGGTDFSKHPNYYKLLADFGLYDSKGNYAPHNKVEFFMPEQVPYLDKNGNKAYIDTEYYIEQELQKEMSTRDSISESLADTSEEGIIPQFIKKVNELHSNNEVFSAKDMDDEYNIQEREYQVDEIRDLFNKWNSDADLKILGSKVFDKVKSIIREQKEFNDGKPTYPGLYVRPYPIHFLSEQEIAKQSMGLSIGAKGVFGRKQNESLYGITYNIDALTSPEIEDQEKAKVLLHEAIHLCTVDALKSVERVIPRHVDTLSFKADEDWSVERKAALELIQIFEQIRVSGDRNLYGQNTVYEMVAELSNVEFRQFLKKQSLWTRVVDAIKRIFCIESNNALDNTTKALEKILEININEDIRYSEKDFSYDELIKKDDLKGIIIDKTKQVKLSPNGNIDADWVVSKVKEKCQVLKTKSPSDTYYINVSDIDRNVEIIKKGITHGFMESTMDKTKPSSDKDIINARVCLELPKILRNSIEVNRSSREGNIDIPYAHIMIGTVGLENVNGNIEYYAVRTVIEERVNQNPILAEAEVLGKLHGVNAKKIGISNVRVADNSVALAPDNAYTYNVAQFLEDVKTEFNDTFSEDVYQKLGMIRKTTKFSKDLLFSEKDSTIYDLMDENEALRKDLEKIKADFENFKELSKLDKKITNGKEFKPDNLLSVAGHMLKIGNSKMDKVELAKALKGMYTYIKTNMSTDNLTWRDVWDRAYPIAEKIMEESKPLTIADDYAKGILKDLRASSFSLDETQKKEAKYTFGDHWNYNFIGNITVKDDAPNIDTMWQEWSGLYPDVFDSDIGNNKIQGLYEVIDSLRNTSEVIDEYAMKEKTKMLAFEIYNQYWNVSTLETTADKYNAKINELKSEHKKMMNDVRNEYQEKIESQIIADDIYYGKKINELKEKDKAKYTEKLKAQKEKQKELYKKLRERKDEEIALAKEHGKDMMARYKENAERKTVMQSIMATTTSLNKKLLKNDKDVHIPETLKPVVANLINAIDYSSKRLISKGIPTQKDVALDNTFGKTKSMADGKTLKESIQDALELFENAEKVANNTSDGSLDLSLVSLDADLIDRIKSMIKSLDVLEKNYGSTFTLQQMELNHLKTLNATVKSINSWANNVDYTLSMKHKARISKDGEGTVEENDVLGKRKQYIESVESFKNFFSWSNLTPVKAFKRLGETAMKYFDALRDAQDELTFHQEEIIQFTDKLFEKKHKEIRKWRTEIKEFDLKMPNGDTKTVRMPISYVMTLYCVSKQEDAKRHLYGMDEDGTRYDNNGGGMTIAPFKEKNSIEVSEDIENTIMTESLIKQITNTLTDEQRKIADELQNFINTKGSEWCDKVSLALYGIKKFDIENYFPITVSPNTIKVLNPQGKRQSIHFFSILNYGFTKSRNPDAKQSIEIGDIFDIFANHMSMAAIYSSYALPIFDIVRWYNYKGKNESGKEIGVITSIQKAFGKSATTYIGRLICDLNGQHEASRLGFVTKIFRNTKLAMVGNSLSVALLQPTAYLKAMTHIPTRHLLKSILYVKDFGARNGVRKAKKYCGIALWKSRNNFDTDISGNVTTKMLHDEKWHEILKNWSLKGAEIMDELTWGVLWNACEFDVRANRKDLKVGSDEYFEEVANKLRDVIYETQVVDSPLTRSDIMRSPDNIAKMLTMFGSEMTVAYNMVAEAFTDAKLDVKRNGKKGAWKRNSKNIGITMLAYTLTSAANAILNTMVQLMRDDEEKEPEDIMKMYFSNFLSDWLIFGKIPYVKEFLNSWQGYSSSRPDTLWMDSSVKSIKYFIKAFDGKEGYGEKAIKESLKAMSYLSRLPMYNQYRDAIGFADTLGILDAEDFKEMIDDIFD